MSHATGNPENLCTERHRHGRRPLLQHQFGPDALPLEKGEKTGVAGNDPEEWRRTCMITPERQMYLRGGYVFSAIRDGAKYTKSTLAWSRQHWQTGSFPQTGVSWFGRNERGMARLYKSRHGLVSRGMAGLGKAQKQGLLKVWERGE